MTGGGKCDAAPRTSAYPAKTIENVAFSIMSVVVPGGAPIVVQNAAGRYLTSLS